MNMIGLISMAPFARAHGVPATRRMTSSMSAASITDKPASGACLLRAGLAVARPAAYGATSSLARVSAKDRVPPHLAAQWRGLETPGFAPIPAVRGGPDRTAGV